MVYSEDGLLAWQAGRLVGTLSARRVLGTGQPASKMEVLAELNIKHYIIRTLAYKAGINKDALHMKQLHTRTRCTYIIKNNSTLCLYSI